MEARIIDLQSQLVGTRDAAERARVHFELGRCALRDERRLAARHHLQEAGQLDASLTDARDLLAELEPLPARGGRLWDRVFRR